SAAMMLERDVANMRNWFGQFAPELLATDYGTEIWGLYQRGELHPDSELSGHVEHDDTITDIRELMMVIEDARREEEERLARESDDEA
ncbi:MAG: serine protein kinase RIO, partial [Pseudomonadota bacterium]|nr:serine protein kinase RIO [Pseudomonadota bacterium]